MHGATIKIDWVGVNILVCVVVIVVVVVVVVVIVVIVVIGFIGIIRSVAVHNALWLLGSVHLVLWSTCRFPCPSESSPQCPLLPCNKEDVRASVHGPDII